MVHFPLLIQPEKKSWRNGFQEQRNWKSCSLVVSDHSKYTMPLLGPNSLPCQNPQTSSHGKQSFQAHWHQEARFAGERLGTEASYAAGWSFASLLPTSRTFICRGFLSPFHTKRLGVITQLAGRAEATSINAKQSGGNLNLGTPSPSCLWGGPCCWKAQTLRLKLELRAGLRKKSRWTRETGEA